MNDLPAPLLILTREDSRTPEEQEVDLLREAQSLTVPLFATLTASPFEDQSEERELLPDEALLHILLQTSDLLTTDNPERYVWRLLAIWHTLLPPSSGSLTFGIAALHYWCAWLIHQLEPQSLRPTYPVLSVSKTELMAAYPELAITIAGLKATEMQHLVQQIEVALQPFYPAALKVALDRYFERCPF